MRIQRSASQPPSTALAIAAPCHQITALTPASPCVRPSSFCSTLGIQSRTTQPAIAGSVKEASSSRNDRFRSRAAHDASGDSTAAIPPRTRPGDSASRKKSGTA